MNRVNLQQVFDRLATPLVVLAAVAVAATAVRREFTSRGTDSVRTERPDATLSYVDDWRTYARGGTRIGDSTARVQIVEFADLECPFCSLFHHRLDSLPAHMRREIAITLIQYPLSYHRFAVPAARALECAKAQGRFGEFVAAVFKKQDSLGLKSFGAFAAEAGVADTSRLVLCTRLTGEEPSSVSRGRALAAKLGVRATPTVLINGWRFPVAPDFARLSGFIDDVLAGRRGAGGGY